MNIKNLTPHAIHIHTVSGQELIVDPEPVAARCSQTESIIDTLSFNGQKIAVSQIQLGAVENLPEFEEGTILVVSRIVAEAAKGRTDIYIPGPAIRDDQGRIIGSKGLSKI